MISSSPFLDAFGNSSGALLSSNMVHLICNLAYVIFNMGLVSIIDSLKGINSLTAVDDAILSSYAVDRKKLFVTIRQHVYLIPHPVFDLTQMGSAYVSIA